MQLTSWLQTFFFFFFWGGGGGKQVKSIQGIRIQHILFQMMVFVTSQIWSTWFTIHAQANTVYIWCCKREEFFSRVHPYFCSWLLRKRFIYKVLTKSVNTMCFSLLALRNKIIVHKTVFVHHNGIIIFKYDTVSLNAPWAWLSPVAVWSALHIDSHRHLWLESRQQKMPKSELTTHNYTVEWDAQKPAGHVRGKFTGPSSDCMTNQSTKPVFFLILLLQLTVLTNPELCQCQPCSFCCCSWKFDQPMSVSSMFFLPLQVKDWSKLQTQCQPVFFLPLQVKDWSKLQTQCQPVFFLPLQLKIWSNDVSVNPCQWQAGITTCQPWCHVRQQKLCSFYHCSLKSGLQLLCHQGTPTAVLEHCEIKNTSKWSSFFRNIAMVVIMFVFSFFLSLFILLSFPFLYPVRMEIWLSRFQSTWCHLPGPSSATDIQSLEKQLCLPLTSPQNSSSESERYICVKWCHSKEMIVTEWRPESALCHPQDGSPTKNINNFFKDNFNSYRWIKLFLITQIPQLFTIKATWKAFFFFLIFCNFRQTSWTVGPMSKWTSTPLAGNFKGS